MGGRHIYTYMQQLIMHARTCWTKCLTPALGVARLGYAGEVSWVGSLAHDRPVCYLQVGSANITGGDGRTLCAAQAGSAGGLAGLASCCVVVVISNATADLRVYI
jgi:hypothetical protein